MRSRLGLPERQLKMLMKIRSTRLYFLGNLIYFSCTTVSLTPVFQVLGHRQLHVSALGLAWPRSDSLSPARAGRCGMGVELLGVVVHVPWCGPDWGHGPETPGIGTRPLSPAPGQSLTPQTHIMNYPVHPTGGLWPRVLFLSKQAEESLVPRRGLRGAQEIYR